MTKHRYGEAYMLMWYICKSCRAREMIWNSRDGVTPFGINCPSCGEIMNHVDWNSDRYEPNHQLNGDQRFFRDGTPDEAETIIRARIERLQNHYPLSDQEQEQLVKSCRSGKEHEFQQGWPILDRKSLL